MSKERVLDRVSTKEDLVAKMELEGFDYALRHYFSIDDFEFDGDLKLLVTQYRIIADEINKLLGTSY